jgi:hypothetical protein|tara:strand:+ start:5076 stop:5549 length:474 start_codon:yes stop_codon:yes gene_type:complete
MFNISDHITLKEATRSNTAQRLNIENFPDPEIVENMRITATHIFEPLREFIGKPIFISSFYRSPKLNKAIGGSTKSQHCKGEAIDIDDIYGGATNADFFNYIKDNLEFDQLIWEFGDEPWTPGGNPAWVHASYSLGSNRMRVLQAYKDKGKTKYKII